MNKVPFLRRVENKIREKTNVYFAKARVKRVCPDFCIISNNCWGGSVYRYFGLPYSSPTIGGYFFAEEYIKFVSNLEHYLSCELEIIRTEDSKYYDILKKNHEENDIVGRIDDVEYVFLHYASPEEAIEKWNRRKQRVNYDNLVFKFNDMNLCEEKHIAQFDGLNFKKKVCFLHTKMNKYKSTLVYKGYEQCEYLVEDTYVWPRYINIFKLLNDGQLEGKSVR